jgi:arylsulfatase
MGYHTPNIDRLAAEGMRFTDSYGEQSCTAGRSSFITGQSCFRTGLSKVGIPASPIGLQPEDPTIAELLKPLGYATGSSGRTTSVISTSTCPRARLRRVLRQPVPPERRGGSGAAELSLGEGFPGFRDKYGPRGVIHSWATDKDDPTEEPRWGRVGQTTDRGHGPLTKKRMETIDDETTSAAISFIKRQHKAGTPFFCWMNTTHMHAITHTKPSSIGQAGRWQSPYHDTMIDHDKNVGQLLDLVDELGIADNTIVMYSTDNGPHMNTWPDGAMTPFRNEKNSNWEGAYRVPLLLRWPGKIAAGSVSNEIVQHHDWLPTFLAAAGEPDIIAKLKKGHAAGRHDVHASTSTASTCCHTSRGRRRRVLARASCISATTATWLACASTTGKSCSWSSDCRGRCAYGRSHLSRCVSQNCSTCAPTRSSGPTSRRIPTGTGSSRTESSC